MNSAQPAFKNPFRPGAGHMPPYLNGEPVAMEGALPLGMIEGAEFSVMRFRLAEGDKLVLVSDGVAEATDADGQLFGFERVNELLRKGKSASEVAGAAQSPSRCQAEASAHHTHTSGDRGFIGGEPYSG